MKPTTKEIRDLKKVIVLLKKSRRIFTNAEIDSDGSVLNAGYNGLCAIISFDITGNNLNYDDMLYEILFNIQIKLKQLEKKYNHILRFFPTNEIRLKFIDTKIKKYEKMLAKEKK